MNENYDDIVEQYFRSRKDCTGIECQKVIFEPDEKREWFFDDGYWCYFSFSCEDYDYQLVRTQEKDFDDFCYIKDMSYEIKMLLAYIRLRNVITIEKEMFSNYVSKFENERKLTPSLTVEKFNYNQKMLEEDALEKSEKTARRILTGCLFFIVIVIIAFGVFLLSMLFAPSAAAKSKYTPQFIQNFIQCRAFSESKLNVAYNSKSTYEIKGFAPDGSGKCVYVETNEWLRGYNKTTCYFDPKQMQEYHSAMLNPDIKGSVLIKGMPVVGNNEEVVYLKFFNNSQVCQTKSVYN